jgi:hypothetical protein
MPDDDVVQVTEEQTADVPPADLAVPTEEPDQFPRSYVEELRAEAKSWRLKAQKAEPYAQRLHTELVKATGRLADPTDMPFNEEHLTDPDALTASIDELLARKPHLASRRPAGDVGQGAFSSGAPVDLAAILRRGR